MSATSHHLARFLRARIPQKRLREVANLLRFGSQAPKADELIWIDPRQVRHGFTRPDWAPWRRRHSGIIAPGDWDMARYPLAEGDKFRACRARFEQGLPWEDTGVYEAMMRRIERAGLYDGCRTLDDVVRRYAEIDNLYQAIRAAGRIEPVSQRPEKLHREHGGIFVHIDRNGQPLLGGNGNHRLAIAQVLNLTRVPAHLGVVHETAWRNGALQPLRAANPET